MSLLSKRSLVGITTIILTVCLSITSHAQQFAYNIIPLGLTARSLNNRGDVVGYVYVPSLGIGHPAYYRNGQVVDVAPNSRVDALAQAVNDAGIMTIQTSLSPALYNLNTGERTDLTQYVNETNLPGINQAGDVAVNYLGTSYIYHSSTGVSEKIAPDRNGREATVTDINNRGQLSGYVSGFGAYYSAGVFTTFNPPPFQGLGITEARALNDNLDVVGTFNVLPLRQHAFLYRNGQATDLGALQPGTSSIAADINNRSQIVGVSGNQPFIYQNGSMTNLFSLIDPSLGWTSGVANAINENGWIVGNGNRGGFLMIPNAPSVPEPCSAAATLTVSSLLAAGLWTRRLRRR